MFVQWSLACKNVGACFSPCFNEAYLGQLVDLYFSPCFNGAYLGKWWSLLLSMYQWSLAGTSGGTWNQTPHVKHIMVILGGEEEYHLRYNLIYWASGKPSELVLISLMA